MVPRSNAILLNLLKFLPVAVFLMIAATDSILIGLTALFACPSVWALKPIVESSVKDIKPKADRAGIKVEGPNKWRTIIENAAHGVHPAEEGKS